jgi:hypothetical protein
VAPTELNSLDPFIPSASPLPTFAFVFFLFLAEGRSCPFSPRFVKLFDSPVYPTVLKVRNFILSSSIASVAHFMVFQIGKNVRVFFI